MTDSPVSRNRGRLSADRLLPLLVGLYALGVALYFVLRFGGNWLDTDTVVLTRSAQATLDEAALVPGREAYAHGFTYPAIVVWLAYLTGLAPLTLQTMVLPWVGAIVLVAVSVVLFRAFLGSWPLAALASLFLYLQPDFLFVTMRGSHEKITWSLAMLALFLLYSSGARRHSLGKFATYVGVFYLVVFALVTTNMFFASTFVTAIVLSLVLGLIVSRFQGQRQSRSFASSFERLVLVSFISLIVLFMFVFYLYTPARDALRFLRGMVDQVATLFLGFEAQTAPYEYISVGWISSWVWLGLTLFTWLLLLGSAIEWLREGRGYLRGEPVQLPESLPWLLYAGFAGEIVIAVILDFAGVLAANMQLRILPGLVIVAVSLAARGLAHLLRWSAPRRVQRFLVAAFTLLIAWSSLASLLKVSNEPLLSNKWSFYSVAEETSIKWIEERLGNLQIWTGIDERLCNLHTVLRSSSPEPTSRYLCDAAVPEPSVRYFLFSETEQLRYDRVDLALPVVGDENLVYDNGQAHLYHKRPHTPYQR